MKLLSRLLDGIIFFGLIILVAMTYFGFFSKKSPLQRQPTQELAPQDLVTEKQIDPNERANKYMQDTQKKITQDQFRAEQNLKKNTPNLSQQRKKASVDDVNPEAIPLEKQIWKDDDINKKLDQKIRRPQNDYDSVDFKNDK